MVKSTSKNQLVLNFAIDTAIKSLIRFMTIVFVYCSMLLAYNVAEVSRSDLMYVLIFFKHMLKFYVSRWILHIIDSSMNLCVSPNICEYGNCVFYCLHHTNYMYSFSILRYRYAIIFHSSNSIYDASQCFLYF